MTTPWDCFDKIYCITTAERPDRQKQAWSQFVKVGLGPRIEFVVVPRHPTNREQGCYEAHMLCMTKGLFAKADHILIFEDDILFDRFATQTLQHCADFLSSGQPWHMLFLGCMVKSSRRTVHPSILKIRYRCLTHAYAIHHRVAQRLVTQPWRGVAYDDFIRNLDDNQTYALYPSFAFQSNSKSDNARYLPLDKIRRLLGGLHSLQKQNEFYHCYRLAIISAHVIGLIAIILAL